MEKFKETIKPFLACLLSMLAPIRFNILAMTILLLINFLFGLASDLSAGEKWNKKKAARFFLEALCFFLLILAMYGIGYFQGEAEKARQAVVLIGWVACWFYGVNISRNGEIAFRGRTFGKICGFFYFILSMKVVDRIPYLNEFLNKDKKEDIK